VKAFVDFQNDVTARDIRLAVAEGFRSVEHIKRFTTNGMATDQGKTSNIHGLGVAAEALSRPMPEVGLTTFRAPFTPVTFGTIAGFARGELFDPTRRTPIHDSAAAEGAVFEDVGMWKRAWYFPRGTDKHAAVDRECRAVREAAGLFDASTLGKIEVTGPDAARFLDLIYATPLASLAVGKCRYALLLNEAGFIIDDGIVARLAEDRFHVTTTTGGAPRVLAHMEDYRQTEFPELDVWTTSITEQFAVIAVQGPRARAASSRPSSRVSISGRPRLRTWRGRVPLHGRSLPAVPRLVHRRDRLRDQRPVGSRARRLGRAARARPRLRRRALRHRGDACAASREGLHHRRPGDRRDRHAGRCRAWAGRYRRRSRTSSASAAWSGRTFRGRAASSWSG
jgi:hypothetical protein